ncbi:HEPN domain-containing protein [Aeromonas caviae]
MLNKNDLQRLAEMRLADAVFLLENNKHSSAYYLAGYAVELAIKACAAKLFQNNSIPDKSLVQALYTHSLEQLMNTSGLLPSLKEKINSDSVFGANWGIATKWNEGSRYEFWDPIAATTLIGAIIDEEHGVFLWVKNHW